MTEIEAACGFNSQFYGIYKFSRCTNPINFSMSKCRLSIELKTFAVATTPKFNQNLLANFFFAKWRGGDNHFWK